MNYQYESLSSSYLILLTKYLFLYKNFGHNLFLKLLSIKVTQWITIKAKLLPYCRIRSDMGKI